MSKSNENKNFIKRNAPALILIVWAIFYLKMMIWIGGYSIIIGLVTLPVAGGLYQIAKNKDKSNTNE